VLVVLRFVARRRLPVVKRTATLPGRVSLQGQDRATCCIAHPFGGYAAKTLPRPVLIPAPFRRTHTAKANPLRGIASQNPNHLVSARCANVTQPSRGKFAAARRALT
jgi:hypothetical protein